MNLIVISSLTCNEGLFFRYISMMAKTELEMNVLIESKKEDIDKYYHELRVHGWFDYVDDFVEPRHRLEGIRIDKEWNYPLTIKTNKISCENTLNLLGQIKSIRDTSYHD
tara:strand:- start:1726 stop:2055 length:330 start_codon:yes stop_codon:yes gene_type:complete